VVFFNVITACKARKTQPLWNLILMETELGNWGRYDDNIRQIYYNGSLLNFNPADRRDGSDPFSRMKCRGDIISVLTGTSPQGKMGTSKRNNPTSMMMR